MALTTNLPVWIRGTRRRIGPQFHSLRVMKLHWIVLKVHTQKFQEAEFRIFSPKVRYLAFKVKLRKLPKTSLITFDLHHIHIIGRCGQGQHNLMASRSQGQSQVHEGRYHFFVVFERFSKLLLQFR